MERDARSARAERGVNLSLVELSVVLVAGQNDPSIINPDFLRYNGIVDNQTGVANPARLHTGILASSLREWTHCDGRVQLA